MNPVVAAVATAVPEFEVPQAEARAFARGFFADDFPHIDRLLSAFDNTGIATRYMARPIEWYRTPRTFVEKNDVYVDTVLDMSERASRDALAQAGAAPSDIGAIVFVSSTGIATPSLDSVLVQRLGLPRSLRRLPLWGLGCAGGAAGLGRAAEVVRAIGKPTLLVAAEACSATFVHGDRSKSNLIATALFGDGAAAAVLMPGSAGGNAVEVLGSHSRLIDDSADVMGWDVHPQGLKVRFARSIPQIVRDVIPGFVREAATACGVEPGRFSAFVLHPGGAKVLDAYADALEVAPEQLEHSAAVIREFGNMSSPTVLFVLRRFMKQGIGPGQMGLAVGLGPGFAAEGVVLRW